jgi:hypothetical protein
MELDPVYCAGNALKTKIWGPSQWDRVIFYLLSWALIEPSSQ